MEINKIYNEDCLTGMLKIPDKSIDMILCDLPYGTTNCRWDSILPFDKLWEQYNRVAKDNAAIVLFAAQPFTSKLITSNMRHYKYNWYWIKTYSTGFAFAKYQPMRRVEDICVFYKHMPVYNPQGVKRLEKPKLCIKRAIKDSVYKSDTLDKPHYQEFTNYPHNTLEFSNEAHTNKNRYHPTQKPVKLLEYLIKTYTNEGMLVLDNCIGSGTTAIACINTGRNYIGFEMDEKYYSICLNRIKSTLDLC